MMNNYIFLHKLTLEKKNNLKNEIIQYDLIIHTFILAIFLLFNVKILYE